MVATAAEADFTRLKEALDGQDYETAKTGFLTLAGNGDPRAMFYLGVMHDRGLGADADKQAAFSWYEKAALAGHPEAQHNLANAFKHGRGTEPSEQLATLWWREAAEQGQPNAQYNLALQYYQGMGVEEDQQQAIYFFQQAAANGHVKAQALIDNGQVPAAPDQLPEEKAVIDRSELISEIRAVQVNRNLVIDVPVLSVRWLAQQNPQHFTIQLAVMASGENLDGFLLNHQLLDRASVVEKFKDEEKRYYVLLGAFEDRTQALDQLEGLSKALKQSRVWVRPFSELQGP